MKRWYLWFVLSGLFAIGGILNYYDGRSILASIIQVSITVFLGVAQFFCDKKGAAGKKVFRYISITVLTLLVLWMIWLIVPFLIK